MSSKDLLSGEFKKLYYPLTIRLHDQVVPRVTNQLYPQLITVLNVKLGGQLHDLVSKQLRLKLGWR